MDQIPIEHDGKRYVVALEHDADGGWAATTLMETPGGKLLIVDQQAGTRETQLTILIDALAAANRTIAELRAQLDVAHLMLTPKDAA